MRPRLSTLATLIIGFALTHIQLYAQTPQEDDILLQINSLKSDNHYPSLMLRYQLGDTTLTQENYHYLYYGYAYQDDYQPLAVNPHIEKLLMLASSLNIDQPNVETLRALIATGQKALAYDPFNLKVWNIMAYAYGALENNREEEAAYKRVMMIISTIKASGDGLKERSPQHILMFDHALDLMAADDLIHKSPMVISRTVEYIGLVAPQVVDEEKIKGYYFDFGRVYWNKPDSVTYKRDRTWQFNNLKPKEYK